jgi:hypothetical protein
MAALARIMKVLACAELCQRCFFEGPASFGKPGQLWQVRSFAKPGQVWQSSAIAKSHGT